MYSAIIVDDEKDQQDVLTDMLVKNFPQISVASVCNNVDDGVEKILKVQPQLVFLDVVMPPKTGFDLLNEIKNINFQVIFTTSYEQYALKAFKVAATDFLLKPFGIEDLRTAVEKFEEKIKLKQSLLHIETLMHNINNNTSGKTKIALPTLSGYVFAQIGDIVHCTGEGSYTTFYFADKSQFMVSRNMKECEELLSDYNFFRIHTSHVINMYCIKEYIKGDGGQVKLTNGTTLDVSRRKKEEFLEMLKKL